MRSISKVFLMVAAGSLLLLNTACNGTHTITVDDTGFNPKRVKMPDMCDAAEWKNTAATGNHSATSRGNGAFFDTGEIAAGALSTPSIPFKSAGNFLYYDKDHPHARGLIEVPMSVTSNASPGDTINVSWAETPCSTGYTIPAGFHADIQILRPGDHDGYHFWKTNQTGSNLSAPYKVHKQGIYRFRARLVKDGVARSEYSPRAVCNVTR